MKKNVETERPSRIDAPCAPSDNFTLEQLRLENLWLRQRLHALAKVPAKRPVDERGLAA